jgi:hypothetical protein
MAPNLLFEKTNLQVKKGVAVMASRAMKIDPGKSTPSPTGNLVEPGTVENVNESAIAALAYQLWQQRGCPIGSDHEDWFRAENELRALKGAANWYETHGRL